MKRLKVKNDFIFQKISGQNERKEILIDFLNAILKQERKVAWCRTYRRVLCVSIYWPQYNFLIDAPEHTFPRIRVIVNALVEQL